MNGNARPSRRFCEVCIELAKTINPARLTEARQAESLQQRVVVGEKIDSAELTRVGNALGHALCRLASGRSLATRGPPSGFARRHGSGPQRSPQSPPALSARTSRRPKARHDGT